MKKIVGLVTGVGLATAVPASARGHFSAVMCVVVVLCLLLSGGKSYAGGASCAGGINREVWENVIEGNLFPDEEFMSTFTDDSQYVNYLNVYIPNAGNVPTYVMDPAFPLNGGAGLNVIQRTDAVVEYTIHQIAGANPFVITNAEEVQLSYDKMASVLAEMQEGLNQYIGDNMLIWIAPTGAASLPANILGGGTNNNILRSTGITNNDPGNIQSSPAYMPGANGNRLNYTLYDIRQAQMDFDTKRIPQSKRHMLVSSQAKQQIISDLIATKYRQDMNSVFDTKEGRIDRLMGFKIWERSNTMPWTNANTPAVKAYGAASSATDNDAIYYWHERFLSKAKGDVIVYEQLNSPTQLGDIYNVLVRAGGAKRRSSELGVGVIVQTASA